ncbi:MAG: bifunctional salicylyl-CoA 5-hydroxylase/oxidoreductase [Polyangiaceae bacterium]
MKIVCIGGGPAGLYFALLFKKAHPDADVTVIERNAAGDTFGWGVVFSDETLGYLEENDTPTYRAITAGFAHWDAIDVHYKGRVLRSGGHGFSGIARRHLLDILQGRCRELGVTMKFNTEVDDHTAYLDADLVVACDGLRSKIRDAYADVFVPDLDVRKARYIWLGTKKIFDAFTFLFEENEHGIFQVHAYRFDDETSTFIAECSEETLARSGLADAPTEQSIAYLEKLFGKYLDGNALMANRSSWIHFTTVRNARWHHENIVLMGDAAHTAHFSIGSGTKLAMEDAIALVQVLGAELGDAARGDKATRAAAVRRALARYEDERRPIVERTQKAAQDSLLWFENTRRYWDMTPEQLTFCLLTRSKRITYDNLKLRDEAFTDEVARHFQAELAPEAPTPTPTPGAPPVPPMFTPFKLRELVLDNRVVVSPMCMYSAYDGTPNDFHFVHYGQRALGGAGLVMTEMTNVSADARISPGCTGMYTRDHVDAWRRIVEFVHTQSTAKIGMQLGHAGRKGATKLMWEGGDQPLESGAWPIVSASPLPYFPHSQVPAELDREGMTRIKGDFERAARWADEAGFDLLELHLAHGYLLASFLSPLTNQRTDAYGGDREARMRYPLEVFEAVRAAWPKHKPMSARISATDWLPGGVTDDDVLALARALKERGCDVVDVSTGMTTPDSRPPFYGRMYQAYWSELVRNEAKLPTITVGNVTTGDQVNTLVLSGRADLVALARPHLANPHFTLCAAREQGYTGIRTPDPYGIVRPMVPVPAVPSK